MSSPTLPAACRRASPLPPDARRQAILDATVPLLRERGVHVTTRELAEAAGVAEGTLFRVFPDKAALVRAAVGQALDPEPLLAELAVIDSTELRPALRAAVAAMLSRTRDVAALLTLVHELADDATGPGHDDHHHPRPAGGAHAIDAVVTALTEVFAPHRDALRSDPGTCAQLLVTLVVATSAPMMRSVGARPPLDPEQVVAHFLDGALVTEVAAC